MRLAVGTDTTQIPASPGRRKLVFRNLSGQPTIYWGFEPNITANPGDANCGIPLVAGEVVTLADADGDHAMPVFFRCATGGTTTLYYTGR